MSAFANCGRAVAHVQGSYVPIPNSCIAAIAPRAGLPQTKVVFTGRTAGLIVFEFARPCQFSDVRSRDGERLAPLAIQDRPPTAGTGGMRAVTPPPQPNKKIAVDATIQSCGWR